MGRLVIAISASVTAFVMALTAGAVYAYRNTSNTPKVVQQQEQPVSQVGTTLQLQAAAPAASPSMSPQDAASLAAKAINRTDLYSIELADYQGAQAYKVTFSSGDIVYVGLDGQVLGSEPPPTPVVITQPGGGGKNRSYDGSSSSGGGYYEDHEEHEGGEGGDD